MKVSFQQKPKKEKALQKLEWMVYQAEGVEGSEVGSSFVCLKIARYLINIYLVLSM